MKKFYAILAAVCLLTACSNGETASETTVASETASVTDTATVSETTAEETTPASETTITEVTTEINLNYTYNFAERLGGTSEEQTELYDFFEENSDNTELFKNIDDSRAQMSQNENLSSAIPENYDIYAHEFFADFDGDGDGELYVYKYIDINPSSQWTVYRELWYTDGESCAMIYSSMGRGSVAGILEPRDGVPLMYIVPDIYIGAHSANVYFIKDGKPVLYELPEGECFVYDYDVEIFIAPSGGNEIIDTPESPQTIGWVNGELKIISGYGENGAEDT